jgi:hypothetical protein
MPKELIVKLKKEQREDGTYFIPDYELQPEDASLEVEEVDYDNMVCKIKVYLKTDIKVV